MGQLADIAPTGIGELPGTPIEDLPAGSSGAGPIMRGREDLVLPYGTA